jgi:hypothetical protein
MKVKRQIMEKNKRYLSLAISVAAVIFLCCLFWPFIYSNIITPLSLSIWLMLRLTVLNIDQKIIWFVMILANIFYLVIRINSVETFHEDKTVWLEKNSYIKNLELWKYYFSSEKNSSLDTNNLRKKLLEILVTAYAAKMRVQVNYKLYDRFRNKEILVPENIYAFLIDDGKKRKKGRSSGTYGPAELLDILTGRSKKDYNRKIEESLNFLENYLEMKDGYKSTEEDRR